jgi:hypothetical protein
MERRIYTILVFKIFILGILTVSIIFLAHVEYIQKKEKYPINNYELQREKKNRIEFNGIIKVDEFYRVSPEEMQFEKLRFSMESKSWYKNRASLAFPPITSTMNMNIKIYVKTKICSTQNSIYNSTMKLNSYQINGNVGGIINNYYWIQFPRSFCNFPDYRELQNESENENQEYLDYLIKNSGNFDIDFGCSIQLPCNLNNFIKITLIRECTLNKYNIKFGATGEQQDW